MSEVMLYGVLSMPSDLFWQDDMLHRLQVDSYRKMVVEELQTLRAENERLRELLTKTMDVLADIKTIRDPDLLDYLSDVEEALQEEGKI